VFLVRYELGFHILEDDVLHSHRREYLISFIALTDGSLLCGRSVSCEVRTGFYIPENDILHSHHRENPTSYMAPLDSITSKYRVHFT
jgi:hypothetical protein